MVLDVYHVPLLYSNGSTLLPLDEYGNLLIGTFHDGDRYRQPIVEVCQKHSYIPATICGYANGVYDLRRKQFVYLRLIATLKVQKHVRFCRQCGEISGPFICPVTNMIANSAIMFADGVTVNVHERVRSLFFEW